ncbi:hypothetical protein ACS0TY_010991 [Phlomoides rotata]
MLEWIREHLVERLQKNRDRANAKWKGKLCPRINKILDRNMEKVSDCIPIKSNSIHYQVRCFDGGQYTIDLQQKTCTCRAWQLCGIPCTHVMCAILGENMDPEDFVHQYYSVDMYKEAYKSIFGINYDALWGPTLYIPPLPPNFGRKGTKGRAQTKRRKEDGEKDNKQKKKEKAQVSEDNKGLSHARSVEPKDIMQKLVQNRGRGNPIAPLRGSLYVIPDTEPEPLDEEIHDTNPTEWLQYNSAESQGPDTQSMILSVDKKLSTCQRVLTRPWTNSVREHSFHLIP